MEGDPGAYLDCCSRYLVLIRNAQDEKDPAKLSAFYNERVKELAVLKRSAIVNQLYGGWRVVVETQKPAVETLERSDS